jgi:hypothetical protein
LKIGAIEEADEDEQVGRGGEIINWEYEFILRIDWFVYFELILCVCLWL